MDNVQQFVYNTMTRTPVSHWEFLEIECRKGNMVKEYRKRKQHGEKFSAGIGKPLFERMQQVFLEHIPCPNEKTVYDVFFEGKRITIDASCGKILETMEKKRIAAMDDEYFIRIAASLEIQCQPMKKIMQIFQCIHPWDSMKQGIPVRTKTPLALLRGICSEDDPYIGKMSDTNMLWILDNYNGRDYGDRPPSTVMLTSLAGRIENHFYPQHAYKCRAFPKATVAVSPFSRQSTLGVTMIRKKQRNIFKLGYGIEMHFTVIQQHPYSLVELEFQPKRYEIEFEYAVRNAILHKFFPNEIATLHFIVNKHVPQFVSHIIRHIPTCHIHVFEDTDFGKEVVPLFMDKDHVACVHEPNFLINDPHVFTEPLHIKKCRVIGKATTLYTKDTLVNGTRFSEKAACKFTDVRTMKTAKIKTAKRNKRKRKRYYNIENVEFIGKHVSVYTLKDHFNYIPPFGFQIAEHFSQDVKHLFQKEAPYASILHG